MTSVEQTAIPNTEPTLRDVMGILGTMHRTLDTVLVRLRGLERGQGHLKGTVSEMQEELRSTLIAFDKDSVQLLKHERRIRRLEKAAAS